MSGLVKILLCLIPLYPTHFRCEGTGVKFRCFRVCECTDIEALCNIPVGSMFPRVFPLQGMVSLRVYGNSGMTKIPEAAIEEGFRELHFYNLGIENLSCSVLTLSEWSLHVLRFSGNKLNSVPQCAIIRLAELRTLALTGGKIISLERGDFTNKNQLEELDLRQNNIEEINLLAFELAPSLKRLILRGNKLVKLKPGQFSALGNSVLEMLDLSFNAIESLSDDVFNGITLHGLDISNNKITQTEWTKMIQGALVLPELCEMNVSVNPLKSVDIGLLLTSSPSLYTLSLSQCSLSSLSWEDVRKIGKLDIARNNLTTETLTLRIGNPPCGTRSRPADNKGQEFDCSQVSINISETSVDHLIIHRDFDFDSKKVVITAEKVGLKTLKLSLNDLVAYNETIPRPSVTLKLYNNFLSGPVHMFLTNIITGFYHNVQDIILDLSDNRIVNGLSQPIRLFLKHSNNSIAEEINSCDLRLYNINIPELDLSGNGIRDIPSESCLLDLVVVLKLNRNLIRRIATFPVNSTGSPRLRYLELRQNGLEIIEKDAFSGLTALKRLDIRDNFLKALPDLAFISVPREFELLALEGNPLYCDCYMSKIQGNSAFLPSEPENPKVTGRCAGPPEFEGFNPICFSQRTDECQGLGIQPWTLRTLRTFCDLDNYVLLKNIRTKDMPDSGVFLEWEKAGPGTVNRYHITYHTESITENQAVSVPFTETSAAIYFLPAGENHTICISPIIRETFTDVPVGTYCQNVRALRAKPANPAVSVLALAIALACVSGVLLAVVVYRVCKCVKKVRPKKSEEEDVYTSAYATEAPANMGDYVPAAITLPREDYILPRHMPLSESPSRDNLVAKPELPPESHHEEECYSEPL